MSNVQNVIDIAHAQNGYVEKRTRECLDSPKDNIGSNNFTKYARDLDEVFFFNGRKQGYAWCSVYVHWLFYRIFGKTNTQDMFYEPHTGNLGAGVDYLWKYFKAKNQTFTKPKVGDLVLFSSRIYTFAHVGFVIGIDEKYIYTSEGNTADLNGVVDNGGCVCEKKYPKTYKYIYGYCRPNWDIIGGYDYVDKEEFEMKIRTLKKGSGKEYFEQIKELQRHLVALGFGVGADGVDGDFGKNTENALKQFQKSKGLLADGIAGEKTYAKLWGIQE